MRSGSTRCRAQSNAEMAGWRYRQNESLRLAGEELPLDFANRRFPEQPAVLAAELRGAFIADATAYRSDVRSFVSQNAPRLLKPQLLLILKRTHAGYAAEPLTKTGTAHPRLSGQIIDSKRLAKMLRQPDDRDVNALR